MNNFLIFYLIGVVISFVCGIKRLKKHSNNITTYEIIITIILSLLSWLFYIALGLGSFIKETEEEYKNYHK